MLTQSDNYAWDLSGVRPSGRTTNVPRKWPLAREASTAETLFALDRWSGLKRLCENLKLAHFCSARLQCKVPRHPLHSLPGHPLHFWGRFVSHRRTSVDRVQVISASIGYTCFPIRVFSLSLPLAKSSVKDVLAHTVKDVMAPYTSGGQVMAKMPT